MKNLLILGDSVDWGDSWMDAQNWVMEMMKGILTILPKDNQLKRMMINFILVRLIGVFFLLHYFPMI